MEVPGLTKSLVDHLRGKIIRGELPPGQRINEAQIASELGVSRSPLREALRILENERLIANTPRKGSMVTPISPQDLDEIYQMREMIECYALQLLEEMKIRDLPEAASCAENTSDLPIPSEEDSPQEKMAYIEALAEFHYKLLEASGNKRLFEFYRSIHSNINRYVFLNAFRQGVAKHRVDDHRQMLRALKQGNYEKARQIIRGHIRFSCDQLKARMQNLHLVKTRPQDHHGV